jgi:hypothetical protein
MNEEVTDGNLFEQFNFLPQMVQILEKLKKNESIENESHKLEINVKKSLELLETLEGAELTEEQQENLYQKLQKELESKTEKLSTFKKLKIFSTTDRDVMELE